MAFHRPGGRYLPQEFEESKARLEERRMRLASGTRPVGPRTRLLVGLALGAIALAMVAYALVGLLK